MLDKPKILYDVVQLTHFELNLTNPNLQDIIVTTPVLITTEQEAAFGSVKVVVTVADSTYAAVQLTQIAVVPVPSFTKPSAQVLHFTVFVP